MMDPLGWASVRYDEWCQEEPEPGFSPRGEEGRKERP